MTKVLSTPEFVLPQDRDQLILIKDATVLFNNGSGKKIGSSTIYKTYRNGGFTAYIIDGKLYVLRNEIIEAKKKWPSSVPRQDGYYPSHFRKSPKYSDGYYPSDFRKSPIIHLNRFTYQITIA